MTPGPCSSESYTYSLDKLQLISLPGPHFNWAKINDTLCIPHYEISPLSYSGEQRKGAIESFADSTSPMDFADRACVAPFPLAAPFPIPEDVGDAIDFVSHNSDLAINEFRNRQLFHLQELANACEADTARWYSHTPDFIASATGGFHVALCAQLANFLGLNATDWLMQFAIGFPLTGILPQRHTFPLDGGVAGSPVHPESLFSAKTARFVARARRSHVKHAAVLWEEALSQVREGWLSPPARLDTCGNFADDPLTPCNIAFSIRSTTGG